MRQAVIAFVVLAVLFAAPVATAADVNDLKAATEGLIKAYNSLDAAALAAGVHDGAVSFGRDDAFPAEAPTEAVLRKLYQQAFDTLESMNVTLIDFQYRVVGKTG